MGNLTQSEKEQILKWLDGESRSRLDIILASVSSFANAIKNKFYDIFIKIGDVIESIWESIVDFFS